MKGLEDSARILVIYVGGTIGMLDSEAGYVPHKGFLASNLRSQSRFHDPEQDSVFAHSGSIDAFSKWSLATKSGSGTTTPSTEDDPTSNILVKTEKGDQYLPSLVTPRSAQGKRIRYAILEYELLIDSAEVELSDWVRIASDIELNYALFDSFVILHGTDTMAYTASALSFLLEDLGKTVIITGAQIPLSELFNDSIENLLGALIIAGHYTIPEVCLFFNHKLLRGNRAIKASSDEFDAFASPSLAPLATIGIEIEVSWGEVLRPGLRPFRAHKLLSPNVATLRIFPGISGKSVRAFLSAGDVQGVVLESYGAGNAPRREELLSAFREAAERGVVIVNVSQCATGAVAPDIYETGRALAAVGIIGGADMTVECALAKLSYLLSKSELSPAQVRKLIAEPLRGELTRVSAITTFSSPSDRLQTLFGQVIECSSANPRSTIKRGASLSNSLPPSEFLPAEFASPWPTSDRDAVAAERALLPLLLGQAASKPGPLLSTLLSACSTDNPSIALINESSTPSHQTPLHLAVLASHLHNVTLLVSSGASVHTRDILSHSALFYAARLGVPGLEIVRVLKDAGSHLGEVEIERGDVGLEMLRAERNGEREAMEVWEEAAGTEGDRAKQCARDIVNGGL